MAVAGLSLAVLGALLELASGPGARLGWWELGGGLFLLKAGFALSAAAFVLCQVLVTHRWRTARPVSPAAVAGWLLSFSCVALPLGFQRAAARSEGSLAAVLEATEEQAYERALQAAQDSGWEVLRADAQKGLIEAAARSPWFGIKESVVVTVRPEAGMSRVEVLGPGSAGGSYLRRLGK